MDGLPSWQRLIRKHIPGVLMELSRRLPSFFLTDQRHTEGLPPPRWDAILVRTSHRWTDRGPHEKPLGCSWVGSWGLWLPRSLHGDHSGRESPQLMAKSRKTRDLALAPASGAEEIGLEGIELGWAGSPQWRPYGTCPPYQICSYSRTSPCPASCPVPLLAVSASGPSGMLGLCLTKGGRII